MIILCLGCLHHDLDTIHYLDIVQSCPTDSKDPQLLSDTLLILNHLSNALHYGEIVGTIIHIKLKPFEGMLVNALLGQIPQCKLN